jgi:DNA-binding response OmpR family regulator
MSSEPGACILIVDDEPDVSTVMHIILSRAGYEAHVVNSGQEALAWLTRRTPDVILLDLMMPDLNGFSLLRQLRASETAHTLPIIVLTARGDHEGRQESRAAGATDFLIKPVHSHKLIEHIGRALALKAGGANASHAEQNAA